MPSNFGEIAGYHNHEAARYSALAQVARDKGNHAEADYMANLAARYVEAAQEQKVEMRQGPGRSVAHRKPRRHRPLEEPHIPFATACWQAILRGAEHLAAAFRPPVPKRSVPLHGLSLH